MLKGIVFALGACLAWSLIYIIPQFISGFTSFEIAMGRFLIHGIICSLIFAGLQRQGRCRVPLPMIGRALVYSLISSVGYYICLLLSLRYATPAISALILGIAPISTAFYGNWKQKEIPFKNLLFPSFLISLGLVIINIPHLQNHSYPSSYFAGLICAFAALAAWTWYVVSNARFLKANPQIRAIDWTLLIGMGTLFWVLLLAIPLILFFENQIRLEKIFTFNDELRNFLCGIAILGVICSLLAEFLWNRASFYLPVSLAGQLTIFETIIAIAFVYGIKRDWPPATECLGAAVLMGAVFYGIQLFTTKRYTAASGKLDKLPKPAP